MKKKNKLDDIIAQLEGHGWFRYMGRDDLDHWKTNTNRYVRLDHPYVDIYFYKNEEKYGSYLTEAELDLFNQLIQSFPEGRF